MKRITRDDPGFSDLFWSRVDIGGPDECWPWVRGHVDRGGYGRLGISGKVPLAHRIAYELEVGPIPEGLHLDHTCHNNTGCVGGAACLHRRCQNPAHLEPVTHAVNVRRGNSFNRSMTHCRRGHEYTPENTLTQKGKYRACKECTRMKQAEFKKRLRERGLTSRGVPPKRGGTHCMRGHEFTPENTDTREGKRRCKECRKARAKRKEAS